MIIIVTAVLIGILYWFFGTELGCAIRATGSNPAMSRAQGINTNFNIVLGLAVSNGLVALSGALLSQYQGFADVGMGRARSSLVWLLSSLARLCSAASSTTLHSRWFLSLWVPSSTTSSSSWC